MATYTHGHPPSVVHAHAVRTAATSCGYLLPHLAAGMSLLDVGCGPGSVTLDLASALGPDGVVVGVDSAAVAIEKATEAAAARGEERTRFETADALALPFADASFDVVHAHQVLQHVAEPVAVLREMARVCRPGGLVAVRDVDFGATTWWPKTPAIARWLKLYTTLARANGGEPNAGRRLVGWAREAGLVDIAESASAWTYATDEERGWLARSWADRLHESLRAPALALGWAADDVEEIASGWIDWASEPGGWFGYLHAEVLGRTPS